MITGVSKAVVLVDGQDEARGVWSGHVGVDATLQGTRRRGALDRGGPASSVPEPGAGGRGSRTPTATAPRQAGPAGLPTTGICFGLTTVTLAWVTGRLRIADRNRRLLLELDRPPAPAV
jgi:hypothetical protein